MTIRILSQWLLLAVCITMLPLVSAQRLTERIKQKQIVEKKHTDLQRKLTELKRDIGKTEAAKTNATTALVASELAIFKANQVLQQLAQKQAQIKTKLGLLMQQQVTLSQAINAQQLQLSRLLRAQYKVSKIDRFKLLLSGDDPSRLYHELQYMSFISQAQARWLDHWYANLAAIQSNQAKTRTAQLELEAVTRQQSAQKRLLEQEKNKHANLLAQLSNKLDQQRATASKLQRDEQRLTRLVGKLTQQIINEQKAAAAKIKRQQRLARQIQRTPSQSLNDKDNIARAENSFGSSFAKLRGYLPLPMQGEVLAQFGSRRGEGPSWKGMFIHAPEGTAVKAVAPGRVIYADELRGFGNLLIIDHGNQYMTVYGNNQSILKQTGALVKTGDTIASAGTSGSDGQSGLYFEMRYQGRAFDPVGWIKN